MSDQDSISPYNINTKLNRNVMKIKKNITRGIISWSSIKFSEPTSYELYGIQYGKLLIRSMEWKDQVSICKLRDYLKSTQNSFQTKMKLKKHKNNPKLK